MHEATDVLLRKGAIQPDVPCFLWQIGTVGSRLYTQASSKPDRFSKIREYLLNFYPADHRMLAVYSPAMPLVPPMLTECTLDKIEEHASDLHQGVTVFLPPINMRPPELD